MRALPRLLALAAAVAVAVAIPRPGGAAPAATPAATVADGDFSHSNSRDGASVLEHPNLGPGHRAEGTVTLVNTGSLGGDFSLSVDEVADAPGPGGGPLSERLDLRVRDLREQETVYDGDLAALESLPLGYFAPGESHTYAIALTFPHGPADNDYAASSTSVRLVWAAVQSDPLRLSVRAPRVQRLMQRKRLLFRAWCNRDCLIATRGTVRVGGRTAPLRTRLTRVLRAGVVRPRVRLPRGLRRDARLQLGRGGAVVYSLTVSARDRVGRRVVVERRMVVRKHGDGHAARVATHSIGAVR